MYDFKSEVTSPFDDAWMAATQELFVTDDDTNCDEMKRYTIEKMTEICKY